MSAAGGISAERLGRLTSPLGPDALLLTGLVADERLSELFTIEIEAVSHGKPVDLHPVLGKMIGVSFEGSAHIRRHFHGMLAEYTELGRRGASQEFAYRLVLRPEQHLKSLNRWSMIHAKKSLKDLIGTLGGQWRKTQLSGTYPKLDYRVQYDESDFDFLSRHLEREGIYYFFNHSSGQHEICFVDAPNAHGALNPASVRLVQNPDAQRDEGTLWTLREHRRIGPTTYSVDDYDYLAPSSNLKKQKQNQSLGKGPGRFKSPAAASFTGPERVQHPGNFAQATASMGESYATVRLEADRTGMARSHAEGNFFAAAVGKKLTVKFEESDSDFSFPASAEYLIAGTRHVYTAPSYRSGGGEEQFHVELELMPADHPYRPALKTPLPRIRGPQTGVVIGPAGEEIYTDKFGRVKVKFFWDTRAYAGESTPEPRSIWVRVGQMSAGKGFGAFMVPRIGHEVIVEFLNGDPDRPIITGSVYNEANLPAFGTAQGNPVQGIRTNSSKGGGGFNEIRLDDTKNNEVFSVQAQKHLKTLVLKGDETRDIKEGSRTTTIDKGDETMTVKAGKRTTKIKGNDSTTIETGNAVHTVQTGNRTVSVDKGNDSLTIKMGNRTTKIDMGNDSTKLALGKSTTQAMQSIELKVGGSSIKIDQTGVTIKGMMIKIEASMMFQTKGLLMQQQASALHIVKGGLVMIN